MAVIGVRISCETFARKYVFARFAASAAWRSSRSVRSFSRTFARSRSRSAIC
jgi:hypothetical protein